jgi:hypothetical protein
MEPLSDTWHSRDLPVLRELARICDERPGGASSHDLSRATDLGIDQVGNALRALESGGYVTVTWVRQGIGRATGVSAEARRLVGLWPTPETALERMVAALEAIADNADDEDTRTRARKILEGLTGAGRQIGIGVATAVVTGQIPS